MSKPNRAANSAAGTHQLSLGPVEVFWSEHAEDPAEGLVRPAGWWWWSCHPGCLPDSDPSGPFDTSYEALQDARTDEDCQVSVATSR